MLLLVVMGGLRFRDMNSRLRALGRQRTLRALGGLVRFRVRRVGHRLMLMRATVDLQPCVESLYHESSGATGEPEDEGRKRARTWIAGKRDEVADELACEGLMLVDNVKVSIKRNEPRRNRERCRSAEASLQTG